MKRTKRVASLFLALLMAFSCMAVPAMAAGENGEDGTMPRKPAYQCPQCRGLAELDFMRLPSGIFATLGCDVCGGEHRYEGINVYQRLACQDCPYTSEWAIKEIYWDIYCKSPGSYV